MHTSKCILFRFSNSFEIRSLFSQISEVVGHLMLAVTEYYILYVCCTCVQAKKCSVNFLPSRSMYLCNRIVRSHENDYAITGILNCHLKSFFVYSGVRGKVNPLQARCGPEGG